jgi:hypothetical protein
MVRTVMFPGARVTAAFLNALNNPVFDGLEIDGHRDKISDDELSDSGVKVASYGFLNALKVGLVSGTTVSITAGMFQLAGGGAVTFPTTNLVLPADGVNYIYFDTTGALTYGLTRPPVGLVIAKVTTAAGTIANVNSIVDLRPRFTVSNSPLSTRVFGGQGSEKALHVKMSGTAGWDALNTVFTAIGTAGAPYPVSGEHWYSSLTVDSSAVVTVNQGAKLYVSGNVTINGTINVTPSTAGGGKFGGSVLCPSDYPSSNGAGLGGASGHNPSGASPTYSYSVSPVGSGGASSYLKTRLKGGSAVSDIGEFLLTTGEGGRGGGSLTIECGGTILVNGIIRANGSAATDPVYTSGIGTNQFFLCSGAGGGSGGLVWLKSAVAVTLSGSSQFEVIGGNGGTGLTGGGVSATYKTNPGGGGGGGWVVVTSPIINVAGFDVSGSTNVKRQGGIKGGVSGTGSNSLAGAAGGSYGGLGGLTDANGSSGQLALLTFTPV